MRLFARSSWNLLQIVQLTMCSRWYLLALVAGYLVNVLVADDVFKEVGARCDPGLEGTWGLWCNEKWECEDPSEPGSNRCLEGETAPPPEVICCLQEGPAPPEDVKVVEQVKSSQNAGLNWNFRTRPTRDVTSTTKPAPIVTKPVHKNDSLIIAKKKCIEYSEYVYEEVLPSTLLEAEPVNVSRCLMQKPKTVSSTVPTEVGEFPHTVALGYEAPDTTFNGVVHWKCGGSLISEFFVLTIAHCTRDDEMGPVRWALLGGTSLSDTNAQRIRVVESLTHPEFDFSSVYHDIALLRLESSPRLSPEVRPACVGNEVPILNVAHGELGTQYVVTGWNLFNDNATTDRLMKGDLYQVTMGACHHNTRFITGSSLLRDGVRPDSMICVGNKIGENSCQRDPGGPAQTRLEDADTYCIYNIDGVASMGQHSCDGDTFKVSVYTRVHHYLPWVASVVWPGEVALK